MPLPSPLPQNSDVASAPHGKKLISLSHYTYCMCEGPSVFSSFPFPSAPLLMHQNKDIARRSTRTQIREPDGYWTLSVDAKPRIGWTQLPIVGAHVHVCGGCTACRSNRSESGALGELVVALWARSRWLLRVVPCASRRAESTPRKEGGSSKEKVTQ